jgi:hypothetical protein
MTNVGYIVAAYAITLVALSLYGLHLWRRLRAAERQLAAWTPDRGLSYGRQ